MELNLRKWLAGIDTPSIALLKDEFLIKKLKRLDAIMESSNRLTIDETELERKVREYMSDCPKVECSSCNEEGDLFYDKYSTSYFHEGCLRDSITTHFEEFKDE